MQTSPEQKPPKLLGGVLVVLGLLNTGVGMVALSLGDSPMRLSFGLGIFFSGILVFRGSAFGAYLYFLTFSVFLGWALWCTTHAGDGGREFVTKIAVPTIFGFFVMRSLNRGQLTIGKPASDDSQDGGGSEPDQSRSPE